MLKRLARTALVIGALSVSAAKAQVLIGGSLNNGNLDRSHATEVVPGFFLPQPNVWVYAGSRTISGPYQDGLDSEPWAGPAPTPVTTDNFLNPPFPEGAGNTATDGDAGIFFKPFGGNSTDGAANISLYQDVPATPGKQYKLRGWAGGEANTLGGHVFALDFLSAANAVLNTAQIDLNAAGLLTPNGQPFNYKEFSVQGIAPAGTATVRARVSLTDGMSNPAGGGQAFVVDDFTLEVPEPATAALGFAGLLCTGLSRRKRRSHP